MDGYIYQCPRCGIFELGPKAPDLLPGWLRDDPRRVALLAHYIRRAQETERLPRLTWDICQTILEQNRLPSPKEQADRLIRWLGDTLKGPGERIKVDPNILQFTIGEKTPTGIGFLLNSLIQSGHLTGKITEAINMSAHGLVTLTMKGWERHEELQRGAPTGRMAFMAMKFGDPELDRLVDDHLRSAVFAAGFSLSKLDDDPKAGSIDDRLRVALQTCRFLIADLTHANNGAYWEAGYAEGLGKPVIYTCRVDKFLGIHFDTAHLMTVKWSPEGMADAAERLKATIRATLPDARKTDE